MAKSFKDKMQQKAAVNPTLQFISQPEPEEADTEPKTVEESKGRKKRATASSTPKRAHPARRAIPEYDEETKSRRYQLLLTPSLFEAVKDKAAEERISINEFINIVLRDATRK